MFTIDASVHINALNPSENGFSHSKALIQHIKRNSLSVYSPTLLLVEVASSLSRMLNNPKRAFALARGIRGLPSQTWISLDFKLAEQAMLIGAEYRLKGADAIYAAVALMKDTTLITRDRQQLERLAGVIPVKTPAQILQEFSN